WVRRDARRGNARRSRHARRARRWWDRFTGGFQREFEHADRMDDLETGYRLRLESFTRQLHFIDAEANIAQTKDAFDVRCDGVMLAAGGNVALSISSALQVKLDARNAAPVRIANHSLHRRSGGRRTFWNAAVRLRSTRRQRCC